jgi:hypothetical protein
LLLHTDFGFAPCSYLATFGGKLVDFASNLLLEMPFRSSGCWDISVYSFALLPLGTVIGLLTFDIDGASLREIAILSDYNFF